MSWHNKVVWSEGLFMRPQLFQQQERYFEHYVHKRAAPLSPFFFGFSDIAIDSEALALGKLILKSAVGVFQDGTPFDMPGATPLPAPLTIRAESLDERIYLAIPVRASNAEETTFDDGNGSLARYTVFDTEVRDSNSIGQGSKPLQLAALRCRLIPEREFKGAWIGLAIARIKAIRSDGGIELDETCIPPVCAFGASSLLASWVHRIHDLTRMRANALAQRLTGADPGLGVVAEMSDYLLLQALNRYEPLLQHLRHVPSTSPAACYELFTAMAGELSTYARPETRRPLESHPPYSHVEPYACLRPLVDDLQRLLNAVFTRSAQRIELVEQAYGMHAAVIDPYELQEFTAVVLAVHASMPLDMLQQQFGTQAKLGSSERLADLVRGHLPGINLRALPVPPRQIPFHSGFVYFELSREGALWEDVASRGGLALHLAGEFPSLKLELWGVRG